MNSRRGFTLVELVIVIVIFGFMMALGAPAFSAWQRKHTVEDQIEKLYNNLQFARMKAYTEKVTWGLWWWANNPFSCYEVTSDNSEKPCYLRSASDPPPPAPSFVWPVKFPITSSNNGIASLSFDTKGFPGALTTLSVSPNYGASIDCISVSRTRIRIGRMNAGSCDPK